MMNLVDSMTLYPEGKEPISLRLSGAIEWSEPEIVDDGAVVSFGPMPGMEAKIEVLRADGNWSAIFVQRGKPRHRPQLARHLRRR